MRPNRRPAAPRGRDADRQAEANEAAAQGRRIRWERHPADDRLLVVVDAASGEVIATVRSLLDLDWNET
jgi:hypothetical protein